MTGSEPSLVLHYCAPRLVISAMFDINDDCSGLILAKDIEVTAALKSGR
jgi:hypothetical protein